MDINNFKNLLEDQHEFPTQYLFKFVAPETVYQDVVNFLSDDTTFKESRTGKYISISSRVHVQSADEVIDIYQKVSTIKGVISL